MTTRTRRAVSASRRAVGLLLLVGAALLSGLLLVGSLGSDEQLLSAARTAGRDVAALRVEQRLEPGRGGPTRQGLRVTVLDGAERRTVQAVEHHTGGLSEQEQRLVRDGVPTGWRDVPARSRYAAGDRVRLVARPGGTQQVAVFAQDLDPARPPAALWVVAALSALLGVRGLRR